MDFMQIRLAVAVLLIVGCKSAEQKQAEAALRQLAAAGTAAAAGLTGAAKAKEPVEFRELKELLPENLPGMNRTSAEGEKAGAMGFVMSNAEARYEGENGGRISIKITDVGAVAGAAALTAFGWTLGEIDKETSSGYERTTTIKGNKGYERYDRDGKSGELSLMVAGRFIVEVNGNDVTVDALKDALDKVDLGKLEQMRNVGVQ
jgi:hypothetical protein